MIAVDVPARGPEEDPWRTELRKVRLYIQDRRKVRLHLDDLEWAIKILCKQHRLKGVPLVTADDRGPGSPGSSSVASPLAGIPCITTPWRRGAIRRGVRAWVTSRCWEPQCLLLSVATELGVTFEQSVV